MHAAVRHYAIVTAAYWGFTLTDGALRMLVLLHFHQLGYSPLQVAMLFLFYEVFGVITNLVGGWLGARMGLNRTMNLGLFLQIGALAMLAVPAALLTVPWVMAAQALSGGDELLFTRYRQWPVRIVRPTHRVALMSDAMPNQVDIHQITLRRPTA